MGLIDRANKKQDEIREQIQTREEDFLSLIRVYLQAIIAAEPKLGISNIGMLPDLKLFKRTLKIPTQGRLGLSEKNEAKKILKATYKLQDNFFIELDKSVRNVCHKQQDVQSYFYLFQSFSNDLLLVLTHDLQWRLRIPKFFHKLIKSSISDGVNNIMTKTDWSAADIFQSCKRLRSTINKFGFTQKWIVDYAFPMIMIAKGAKYGEK